MSEEENDIYENFFSEFGECNVVNIEHGVISQRFSVEFMYQMFRERFMDELKDDFRQAMSEFIDSV